MILGEDYGFRDDMKEETVPIELLTGPYKGVILRYNTVAIKEMDDDTAKLLFDYELLEMGNHTETSLRKDNQFTQHIGLVLNSMILETLDTLEDNNAVGEDDTMVTIKE